MTLTATLTACQGSRKTEERPGIPEARIIADRAFTDGTTSFSRMRDGARMVVVPGGSFERGCARAGADCQPIVRIQLDEFLLDEKEVSRAQFLAFQPPPWWDPAAVRRHSGDPTEPMSRVSWDEAAAYCHWAGARLPTEAEWEYAARGPAGLRFVWGDGWPPPNWTANLADTAATKLGLMLVDGGYEDGAIGSAAPGSFPLDRSWCGVLDLAGNLSEWCHDWYDPAYYASAPHHNPGGPKLGDSADGKIVRGASYRDGREVNVEASTRSGVGRRVAVDAIGFRCASDSPRAGSDE